ncbi:MAG: thiamine pyrophosphate-dependent dehydrogenase E1 component subunit alpha [Desulfobacterales bacterium]
MAIGNEVLRDMYTKMLTIRHFEERMLEQMMEGALPGGVHTYIGEEAVGVGVCANLRIEDRITSTHRGHGHIIAKGGDVKRMMAELFGKKTGYCKGKGGSMHIADFSLGILGANGIVGGGLPTAAGSALASQLRGDDQVTVCFFGDGAANQGTFHEAVNLAALWRLPVIYVCENNLYAVTTPAEKSISIKDVADRGASYGIPGIAVDGQDIMAVYEATAEAVKRARAGDGPSLIECKTYRFMGHMGGKEVFEGSYRTSEEVEEWKKRDPIVLFEADLLKMGVLTKADVDGIDKQINAELDDAVTFAKESPLPDPEDALEDLYA